jgi:nitric oxide reductase NorD protein
MVKAAAARGPTLGGLFARHLVPVLTCGDDRLAGRFEEATRIMLQKGTYTLKAPLEALSKLIEKKDMACAHAFLDLLATTYALDISYNRTVYLTHTPCPARWTDLPRPPIVADPGIDTDYQVG